MQHMFIHESQGPLGDVRAKKLIIEKMLRGVMKPGRHVVKTLSLQWQSGKTVQTASPFLVRHRW